MEWWANHRHGIAVSAIATLAACSLLVVFVPDDAAEHSDDRGLHECTNTWSLRESAWFGLEYGSLVALLFLAAWSFCVWSIAAVRAD